MVFPTSRSFFVAPSLRQSGRNISTRSRSKQTYTHRSGVDSKTPQTSFSPPKELHTHKITKSIARNESYRWSTRKTPIVLDSNSQTETTQKPSLSSPEYLQALLESPLGNCQQAVRHVAIEYESPKVAAPKAPKRVANAQESNNECLDYRKYLRSTRRDRVANQEQCPTATSLSDEVKRWCRNLAHWKAEAKYFPQLQASLIHLGTVYIDIFLCCTKNACDVLWFLFEREIVDVIVASSKQLLMVAVAAIRYFFINREENYLCKVPFVYQFRAVSCYIIRLKHNKNMFGNSSTLIFVITISVQNAI